MVLLKMLIEIATPRWESCWWWWGWRFPPPGGKFPRRSRYAGGQKCSCPSSASRRRRSIPKDFSLFFLGQNDLYTKNGHQRWAEEATTHQGAPGGPSVPWCLVLTRWPPPVVICSSISYLFHKNSSWSFNLFGVVQNSWHSFSRSRFLAARILPLCVYLA